MEVLPTTTERPCAPESHSPASHPASPSTQDHPHFGTGAGPRLAAHSHPPVDRVMSTHMTHPRECAWCAPQMSAATATPVTLPGKALLPPLHASCL